MLAVSTLNSLVYGINEHNTDLLYRNRSILLRHSTNICNWINMWTVGDSFNNGKKDVPTELLTFDDYAEQTMKEVRIVMEKVKETKL